VNSPSTLQSGGILKDTPLAHHFREIWQFRIRNWVGRGVFRQNLAFLFCILFGLCLIVNTLGAGDGVWFWYSSLFLHGKKLYADLHLVQQPLMIIETAVSMKLLGDGWLISKVAAVLHLLAYCLALLILVRKSDLSDSRKALLLASTFFISISFEAYRFDDYHVITDAFVLYTIIGLLQLQKSSSWRGRRSLISILGILSGLALTTRLNDGFALIIGVTLAIFCSVPKRKVFSIFLYGIATSASALLIVLFTGDSVRDYLMFSVFKAAGSKGGIGQVFLDPVRVPFLAIQSLSQNMNIRNLTLACGIALVWAFWFKPRPEKHNKWEIALGALGSAMIGTCWHQILTLLFTFSLLNDLSGFFAILLFPTGIWIFGRFLRHLSQIAPKVPWNKGEILLLIPIGQFASGAMSSGGYYEGLFQPLAVVMLLAPICSPLRLKRERGREFLFVLMLMLLVPTFLRRAVVPYSWHSYREHGLFAGRTWYTHPKYGLMFIDRDLLEFVRPVCDAVDQSGANDELLSLPFPFANYFCTSPPWHGYVQTFFDTSNRQVIDALLGQLQASPPHWILYQRQMFSLYWHEKLYNQSRPLPHRDLDALIQRKLASNEWKVAYKSDYSNQMPWDTHWVLIRTQ
jgi:hypothetical protein